MNVRHLNMLAPVTLILTLIVGCGPEKEIESKAQTLCAYNQLDAPTLDFVPSTAFEPEKHISKEDLAFLAKKSEEEAKNPFAGLGQAFAAGLGPGAKAMVEANARVTTCKVELLTLDEKGLLATVKITRSSPKPNVEDPFKKMGELAEIEGHEARVKKALAYYEGDGIESETTSSEITFIKEGEQWVISYKLEEAAAKVKREEEAKKQREREEREKRQKALALVREANEAMKWINYKEAKELLEQARKLGVDHIDDFDEIEAGLDKNMAEMVAGRWRVIEEVDEMTDDRNVFVALYAIKPIQLRFNKQLPTIYARCQEGKFALYVNVGAMIDADWRSGTAKVRYRFDADDAETARLGRSDDRKALFFRKEQTWLKTLMERDGQVLKFEVPLYSEGDALLTFDLTGAKQALPKAMEACSID